MPPPHVAQRFVGSNPHASAFSGNVSGKGEFCGYDLVPHKKCAGDAKALLSSSVRVGVPNPLKRGENPEQQLRRPTGHEILMHSRSGHNSEAEALCGSALAKSLSRALIVAPRKWKKHLSGHAAPSGKACRHGTLSYTSFTGALQPTWPKRSFFFYSLNAQRTRLLSKSGPFVRRANRHRSDDQGFWLTVLARAGPEFAVGTFRTCFSRSVSSAFPSKSWQNVPLRAVLPSSRSPAR